MSPGAVAAGLAAAARRPVPVAMGLGAGAILAAAASLGDGLGAAAARAAAVLLLLALAAALLNRGVRPAARSLSLDARQPLGRECGVAVLRAGGRCFLVGYGGAGARILAELPREETP